MLAGLAAIPDLRIAEHVPLSEHTRFGIGGPARFIVDACSEEALISALGELRSMVLPVVLMGGGSNLVVSDQGFDGAIVRYRSSQIRIDGDRVEAGAGALLQDLVDRTIAASLGGLETMTRIPGWVGGAVYGNAGAYGRSMHEMVETVRFLDCGANQVREFDNPGCEFRYRESAFKQARKQGQTWLVLSATLNLEDSPASELEATARGIAEIRDAKFPPTMKCAGSIFKNLLLADLPQPAQSQVPDWVVREGKVPSAYFLEAVGAKGTHLGGIRVADYHANLLYNEGGGTAAQIREIASTLKRRVWEQFGVPLEEEVQYVGEFPATATS